MARVIASVCGIYAMTVIMQEEFHDSFINQLPGMRLWSEKNVQQGGKVVEVYSLVSHPALGDWEQQ